MDKRISEGLNEMHVVTIFRYVDNYLVFVDDHWGICFNDVFTKVVELFHAGRFEVHLGASQGQVHSVFGFTAYLCR